MVGSRAAVSDWLQDASQTIESACVLVGLAVQCAVFRTVDSILFKTMIIKIDSGGPVGFIRTMVRPSGQMVRPRRLSVLAS